MEKVVCPALRLSPAPQALLVSHLHPEINIYLSKWFPCDESLPFFDYTDEGLIKNQLVAGARFELASTGYEPIKEASPLPRNM